MNAEKTRPGFLLTTVGVVPPKRTIYQFPDGRQMAGLFSFTSLWNLLSESVRPAEILVLVTTEAEERWPEIQQEADRVGATVSKIPIAGNELANDVTDFLEERHLLQRWMSLEAGGRSRAMRPEAPCVFVLRAGAVPQHFSRCAHQRCLVLTRATQSRLVLELLNQETAKRRATAERARQEAEEQAAFEASLANASEPLRKLKQLQREQNWQPSTGDNRMIDSLKKAVVENPQLPDDCVVWIRHWLESIPNYAGVWENPDAMTGKKKDKPKYPSKAVREVVKQIKQQNRG